MNLLSNLKKEKAKFKKNNPIGYFLYYHIYLPVYRFWHNKIKMMPKEIKWFIQRGRRGYADCDLWSFDSYLSKIIYTGLSQLKEHQHILPLWEEGMSEEDAKKRWHHVLDEIIWAYKRLYDCVDGEAKYMMISDEEQKRINRGVKLFTKHFHSFWD